MERLTRSGFDYCAEYCVRSADCGFFKRVTPTPCEDAAIYNRLAAYEDTGLEPEEVFALQMHPDHAYADYVRALWHDIGGVERMEELVKAEREGRLVVLPCKVGDTVYRIVRHRVDVSGYRMEWEWETMIEAVKFRIGMTEAFGKTIFLTREEAEQRLKEAAQE